MQKFLITIFFISSILCSKANIPARYLHVAEGKSHLTLIKPKVLKLKLPAGIAYLLKKQNIPTPVITFGHVTGAITSCAGTPSASPDIQQFTVSGNNLKAAITVTAPAGFEVSRSSTVNFGSSAVLVQAGGKVTDKVIYVRSSVSATGDISGKVLLTSPGADDQKVAVSGTIHDLPTINLVNNQTVFSGDTTTTINFAGTGNNFNWVNDTPGIGLAASGTGSIGSFTAVNTGTSPVTATITVTPNSVGYVCTTSADTISVINPNTNKVEAKIYYPLVYGIAESQDGKTAYALSEWLHRTIAIIDLSTKKITKEIDIPNIGTNILLSPDGNRLYAPGLLDSTLYIIDTRAQILAKKVHFPLGLGTSLDISSDGKTLYLQRQNGYLYTYNTVTGEIADRLDLGAFIGANFKVSADGSHLYSGLVNCVTSLNLLTGKVISTKKNYSYSYWDVALSPDQSLLYGSNLATDTLTVYDAATLKVIDSYTSPIRNSLEGIKLSPDGNILYITAETNVQTLNLKTRKFKFVNVPPVPVPITAAANSNCTGAPTQFTITVKPSAVKPTITATGIFSPLTTTYGTASSSTNFTVAGINMTAGILVTPPAGFEVSTDNVHFSNTVTIDGTGTINATPVYVRLSQLAPAGPYTGNITLSSAGAADKPVSTGSNQINKAQLVITANDKSKNYGEVLTGGPGFTTFISDGLKNSETIGSVSITYGPGAAAGAAAATYPNSVIATLATGGTFNPDNYDIHYNPGSIIVNALIIPIISALAANLAPVKTYGQIPVIDHFTISGKNLEAGILVTPPPGYEVSTDGNIFSNTITLGAAGTITSKFVYIRLMLHDAASVYQGDIMLSSAGAADYPVTINGIVNKANLTITGPVKPKPYGTPLTSPQTNSTDFTPANLQFSETVGTVTLDYGTAAAANAPAGSYPINPSGALGGTFNPDNYNISYLPGTLEVKPVPTLSVTGTPAALSTVYGTASAVTGFDVSGVYMLAGIKVTAPPGFEVSTDNASFNTAIILGQSGAIAPAHVYIRLAKTTIVNSYQGTIAITSQGVNDNNSLTADGTVAAAPLTITADDKSKVQGTANPVFTLFYTGFVNNEDAHNLTAQPVINTTAVTSSAAGDYSINIDGAASPNYTISYINGVLTIKPAALTLSIPNTFTPNGDGINDTWIIGNIETYPQNNVEVFNRYGAKVYSSTGYSVAWDGKYKGEMLPTGTYYYIVNISGKAKTLSGSVTIIR